MRFAAAVWLPILVLATTVTFFFPVSQSWWKGDIYNYFAVPASDEVLYTLLPVSVLLNKMTRSTKELVDVTLSLSQPD